LVDSLLVYVHDVSAKAPVHPAATTKAAKAANAAARRMVTSQHSTRHQNKTNGL